MDENLSVVGGKKKSVSGNPSILDGPSCHSFKGPLSGCLNESPHISLMVQPPYSVRARFGPPTPPARPYPAALTGRLCRAQPFGQTPVKLTPASFHFMSTSTAQLDSFVYRARQHVCGLYGACSDFTSLDIRV